MANRPDPNNPQPGDVFFNLDGDKRTIINRLGDWCWVDRHDGGDRPSTFGTPMIAREYKPAPPMPPDRHDGGDRPSTFGTPMIAREYEPAPPMPPDRWGVMYDDGAVITWSAKDMARNAVASERDTFLVHYVGTVVEP